MRRTRFVFTIFFTVICIVFTNCGPPYHRGVLTAELHTVGIHSIPGGYGYDRSAVTELLETDTYGRSLFKYSAPSSYYWSDHKKSDQDYYDTHVYAYVICQGDDKSYAYYYPFDCYLIANNWDEFDNEMIQALKARNDWGNPLDTKKMRKLLLSEQGKWYGCLNVPEVPYSLLEDAYFDKVDRDGYNAICSMFDYDANGISLWFIRETLQQRGYDGTLEYGDDYFFMISKDLEVLAFIKVTDINDCATLMNEFMTSNGWVNRDAP